MFNYCECGCHGNELKVGTLYMWVYTALDSKCHPYMHFIHKDHGRCSKLIKSVKTWAEVMEYAKSQLQSELVVLQTEIDRVKRYLEEGV